MSVKLICIDVDGTLAEGIDRDALPGMGPALATLRDSLTVRLVTNATSRPHRALVAHLTAQGLLDTPDALITPATAARRVLTARGHAAGLLLVDAEVREDFAWFREDPGGPAVLLGSEAHDRSIADLQPAFRALLGGATFYTLQRNRFFRRDGDLVTDLGPVAAFLSYAAGVEVETLGKPSPLLFEALAAEAGCDLDEVLMIGDDAEFDASGSVALGMQGLLVRTGKYRPGDEKLVEPRPTDVIDSLAELPRWLGL
jgi:HAD superfamily hydrolase (TIGR01458 family)